MVKYLTILIEEQPGTSGTLQEILQDFSVIKFGGVYQMNERDLLRIEVLQPDLIFIDYNDTRLAEVEWVSGLNQSSFSPYVIVIQDSGQNALRAIKHPVCDSLVKPIAPEELEACLNRFLLHRKESGFEKKIDRLIKFLNLHHKIRFDTRQGFFLISPADIIFARADWNYTEMTLINHRKELVTINIGKVESILPPDQFLRINRSNLINLQYIDKLLRKTKILVLEANGESFQFKVNKTALLKLKTLFKT